MKYKLTALFLTTAIAIGTLVSPVIASASTPRRGEFCAKVKLGHHYGHLVCKKIGHYNRWE